VEDFINAIIALLLGTIVLQVCAIVITPILAIFILIWWIQTLLLCLQQEEGSDKTTYTLVIVFLGPLGALVYRLLRTSPSDGARPAARPESWLATPAKAAPAPARRRPRGWSTEQIILISFSSLVIGGMLMCICLIVAANWNNPALGLGPTPIP
jgi:hypothetical protein